MSSYDISQTQSTHPSNTQPQSQARSSPPSPLPPSTSPASQGPSYIRRRQSRSQPSVQASKRARDPSSSISHTANEARANLFLLPRPLSYQREPSGLAARHDTNARGRVKDEVGWEDSLLKSRRWCHQAFTELRVRVRLLLIRVKQMYTRKECPGARGEGGWGRRVRKRTGYWHRQVPRLFFCHPSSNRIVLGKQNPKDQSRSSDSQWFSSVGIPE